MRKVLFTICGRAGSKGLRNKNIKKMNDIPLIHYTLAAIALYERAYADDGVFVALNTDSKELIKQANSQSFINGIEIVPRRETLAGDVVPKVSVIKDTYLYMRDKYGSFDHIVDLDITSPMRRLKDIEAAIIEMEQHEEYDIVFSVVPSRRSPYFNMVEMKNDGVYRKVCQSEYTARQQAPTCYELNASIYDYRPRLLESEISLTILDYACGIVEMTDYLVLDIDSEEDFELMQLMMKYFIKVDSGIADITDLINEHKDNTTDCA